MIKKKNKDWRGIKGTYYDYGYRDALKRIMNKLRKRGRELKSLHCDIPPRGCSRCNMAYENIVQRIMIKKMIDKDKGGKKHNDKKSTEKGS